MVVAAVTGAVDVGALIVTRRCLGCRLVADGWFGFCCRVGCEASSVDIDLHVVGSSVDIELYVVGDPVVDFAIDILLLLAFGDHWHSFVALALVWLVLVVLVFVLVLALCLCDRTCRRVRR